MHGFADYGTSIVEDTHRVRGANDPKTGAERQNPNADREGGAPPASRIQSLMSLWAEARQPAFFLPFLLFAFLLLFLPNCRPTFGDEISAIVMTRGTVGSTIGAVAEDVHPPVYFLALKLVRAFVGERVWALRLLSVVFALGAFPFLWAVARRFFGRNVAVPAWLLASSSFVIFASRFVRYYSLGLLETAVATYLLFRLLERPARPAGSRFRLGRFEVDSLWVTYGAVMALSLYTFYLSVITLAAHAVVFFVAWRRNPRRFVSPLVVAMVVLVLLLPWLGIAGRQAEEIARHQPETGLIANIRIAAAQMAYTFYAFVAGDSISPFALPFSLAIAVFYGVLALIGVRRVWQAQTARRHVIPAMVGLGLLVPAILRLIGLLPVPFIYVPVRLLFVAPFFVWIVGCGILAIGNRRVRELAFATCLAIQALSLFNYYTLRQWTNWAYVVPGREIIDTVEQRADPDDLVIFDEWNLGRGPYFYWDGEADVWRFGPSAIRLPARIQTADRVWIVRAVRDTSRGRRMDLLLSYFKRNFLLQERRGYVSEPPAIFEQKKRWLRREVFPHKIETLVFRQPSGRDIETMRPEEIRELILEMIEDSEFAPPTSDTER